MRTLRTDFSRYAGFLERGLLATYGFSVKVDASVAFNTKPLDKDPTMLDVYERETAQKVWANVRNAILETDHIAGPLRRG